MDIIDAIITITLFMGVFAISAVIAITANFLSKILFGKDFLKD